MLFLFFGPNVIAKTAPDLVIRLKPEATPCFARYTSVIWQTAKSAFCLIFLSKTTLRQSYFQQFLPTFSSNIRIFTLSGRQRRVCKFKRAAVCNFQTCLNTMTLEGRFVCVKWQLIVRFCETSDGFKLVMSQFCETFVVSQIYWSFNNHWLARPWP